MSDAPAPSPAAPADPILRGTCHVLFAYDLGMAIDLDQAERLMRSAGAPQERRELKLRRRAPKYFAYHPAPVRTMEPATLTHLGDHPISAEVDAILYDFGATSVGYTLPFEGPLDTLLDLADRLYECPELLADSRRRVEDLLAQIHTAVAKPRISGFVEDYAIFQVQELRGVPDPAAVLSQQRARLAQVLRAERGPLSPQEIEEALACRVSFGPNDCAMIDWNSAIVFDTDAADVLSVLEFANVELLEMRHLDDRLDTSLEAAYQALSAPSGLRRILFGGVGAGELHRIAQMQVDSAILFEGVNNALKLLGDQYLARVYRLAGQRLHLPEWDASILRKLQTLESIYEKVSDRQATRRLEFLEWIVIVLIAVEVVLGLFHR